MKRWDWDRCLLAVYGIAVVLVILFCLFLGATVTKIIYDCTWKGQATSGQVRC